MLTLNVRNGVQLKISSFIPPFGAASYLHGSKKYLEYLHITSGLLKILS